MVPHRLVPTDRAVAELAPVAPVPPGPADRALLDAPGGFLWWYLDLVDGRGDGLVLVASWGLPFLPGVLDAARRGEPWLPRDVPALSLAVYRGGRCAFYLLHVAASASHERTWAGERLTFDRSVIDLGWGDGGFSLVAAIDADTPGERVTGVVRAFAPSPPPEDVPSPVHGWALLGAGRGDADLDLGTSSFRTSGRAYVDRNGGTRPIDALGMTAWTWARVAMPYGDLVLWDVDGPTPQRLAVLAPADGRRTTLDPLYRREGTRFAMGAGAPAAIEAMAEGLPAVRVELGPAFEASPFYARFPVVARDALGREGRGFAERCVPGRVDAPWMRPLVRMCVQGAGATSPWLPLFAGSREGRLGRLLRAWVSP